MIWILVATSVIVIGVISVPLVIKSQLNAALNKMAGYTGQVEQVRLNLFTAKIYLYRITIRREDASDQYQFLAKIPSLIISFHWRPLFKGILDLDIVIDSPELFFIDERTSEAVSHEPSAGERPIDSRPTPISLRNPIGKLMPFRVTLEVHGGKIDYMNSSPDAIINATVTDIQLIVTDFSNRPSQTHPCKISFTGSLLEGNAVVDAKLFPLSPELTFDANMIVRAINLVLLNDLFKSYMNVDLNKGALDLYSEIAVANNGFKGYIKPILKDLDFIGLTDKGDTIFQKIWERVVALSIQILKNHKNGQVATRIPLEGRLDDPEVDVKKAVAGVLQNAFIKAFKPSLDDVVNVRSVWRNARSQTAGFARKIIHKLRAGKKTTQ